MIQLTLTYGSTTVNLMADGRIVLDGYYPEVSEDGSPVTDRFDVWASGTQAEIQASIAAIELAFEHARQHPNDPDGCWINYALTATDTTWRSRVLGGVVMHDARLDARMRQGRALLGIAVTRLPYWEGAEEIVPLSNSNGTDVTTGLTVYNCNDGSGSAPNKRVNYADIGAGVIDGNLPSPAKLIIKNTFATHKLFKLWIGHNYTDPANFVHLLEAENATGATPHSDSGCSGGSEVQATLSTDAKTDLLKWTLPSTLLNAAGGRYVHAVARFSNSIYIRQIRFSARLDWNVTTIWESQAVLPDTDLAICIRDLFAFRLPPWLQSSTGLDAIDLILSAQRTAATSMTLAVDYLMLMPADSFRMLSTAGYGVAQNGRIIDDGMTGELYRDDGAGTGKVGIVRGLGGPIMLQPGKAQRLYFLAHATLADTASILHTLSIQVVYRPRRKTI